MVFKNCVGGCRLDQSDSGEGSMTDFCGHSKKKILVFKKKTREFIGYFRDQWLLKDSAPYNLHQWLPTDSP